MIIGVLAVQGAFAEHIAILESLNNDSNTLYEEITVVQVKRFNHIFNIQHHEPIIDGLILPGGESTTMALIASKKLGEHELTLWDGIRIFGSEPFNRPIWGTCAGLILLSSSILNPKIGGQPSLGLLDCSIQRNAFGRQIESFTAGLKIKGVVADDDKGISDAPFPGVFIRAPIIKEVGPNVQILCQLQTTSATSSNMNSSEPRIVAVQQGSNILGTSFHPELTKDTRVHRYFLDLVVKNKMTRR